MKTRIQPFHVAVVLGGTAAVTLCVVWGLSYDRHFCYHRSGHSLWIGNGTLSWGYGWGWIRRIFFHHSRAVPVGWRSRLATQRDAGLQGELELYPVLLVVLLVTLVIAVRRRIWFSIPEAYLCPVLHATLLEILLVCWLKLHGVGQIQSLLIVVVSIGVPIAVLRWLAARRIPPGHCRDCRYNLTGNTSGRCPECGLPCRPLESTGPACIMQGGFDQIPGDSKDGQEENDQEEKGTRHIQEEDDLEEGVFPEEVSDIDQDCRVG